MMLELSIKDDKCKQMQSQIDQLQNDLVKQKDSHLDQSMIKQMDEKFYNVIKEIDLLMREHQELTGSQQTYIKDLKKKQIIVQQFDECQKAMGRQFKSLMVFKEASAGRMFETNKAVKDKMTMAHNRSSKLMTQNAGI